MASGSEQPTAIALTGSIDSGSHDASPTQTEDIDLPVTDTDPRSEPATFMARIGAIGDRPGDSEQERLAHRFLIYMGLMMSCGGACWGIVASVLGFFPSSLVPLAYPVITAINFSYLKRSKDFERVRFVQVLISLLLPFLFQWTMGGFYASGASVLWALLAILGTVTFSDWKAVKKWLIAYSLLAIVSGALDATFRAHSAQQIEPWISTVFFVGNIVFFSNMMFGLVMYFLQQREANLEALASAHKEIHGLRKEVKQARKLGQYTLQRKLGEGGMGVVFLARHALMRRPTAIKLVPSEKAGTATLARFEREVQLTSMLTHPNTITIYDYGHTPEGVFYYAMEFLEGVNLKEVVRATGALPAGRIIRILHQVAGALSEAHGIGLIHRDIKPANIMLADQGGAHDQAKILDFGLVKEMQPKNSAETQQNAITGTPQYMAPENMTDPENISGSSDIYSLGAVGYFLMTGNHVFDGATDIEICASQLHADPVTPSDRIGEPVDTELEALVLSCLAKNPADRPPSAHVLRQKLRELEGFGTWSENDAKSWWEHYRNVVGPSLETDPLRDDDTALEITLRGRHAASTGSSGNNRSIFSLLKW